MHNLLDSLLDSFEDVIEWRATSEDFTFTRRYGRLSLEKGLVGPGKEATEKIRSLLQWIEALKRSAMYRARSRASVRSSCGSVGPYPVSSRTSVDVGAILATHDIIDWLQLYVCPSTVTFKYSRTKNSRMAADPRKPRTLNPAKIKAYTYTTVHAIATWLFEKTTGCSYIP